jgi:heme exporter protein C
MTPMPIRRRIAPLADGVLPVVSTVAMLCALACVFLWVPNERMQGPVQRIFYFHVNAAWEAFTGFGVAALASLLFLWRGRAEFDRLAHAAVEVGMLFCTMVLVSGPIWARPIWGTWWTWDPRLTMTVILWTIYAVYLAVLAIVGVLDVPLIMVSVRLWRGMHPSVISAPSGTGAGIQDSRMIVTLIVAFVAFLLLFLWLLWRRYEDLRLRDELHALEDELAAFDASAARAAMSNR